jgi:hypothetical protein
MGAGERLAIGSKCRSNGFRGYYGQPTFSPRGGRLPHTCPPQIEGGFGTQNRYRSAHSTKRFLKETRWREEDREREWRERSKKKLHNGEGV